MIPLKSEKSWWNESDSSSDSSYSSSRSNNSSCPDWEEEVTPQGDLFYVVRYPKPSHPVSKSDHDLPHASAHSTSTKKEQNEKPSSGILVKLIRRKSSKRPVKRIEETTSGLTQSTPSLPKVGEAYSIQVGVSGATGWPKPNQSLLEAKLGIIAESHKSKLLIQSFSPDMMSFYQPTVAIGDWLCSIDNIAVTPDNIEAFLESLITPKDVILKLKSMKNRKPNGSFLRKKGVSMRSQTGISGNLAWLVYVSAGCVEGNVTYKFPPRPTSATPGAFLTLAHLLNTLTSQPPTSSTLCLNNELVNVVYTLEGNDVLLVCLPQDRISLPEALRLNNDLVRCLKFNFQSLARCFSSKEVNKVSLDEMISNFFRRASRKKYGLGLVECHFDSLLPGVHFVPLPKKIQVQIGDALNELESNDIKEYEGKRLYSVVGTVLIHKGYVVRSQTRDLEDVGSFLRGCHLLNLTREGVQDLVVWREVFPSICRNASGNEPYTLLASTRTFLLAVAQEHDMLIVLYESGGCTLRLKGNPGPDAVYVEEAQATLEHVQGLAFSKYLTKWFEMNENFHSNMERTKSTDSHVSDKSSARSVRMADSQWQGSFEYPPVSGYEGGVRVRSWSLPSVNAQALSRKLAAEKLSISSAEQQSLSMKSESDISEETEIKDQRSIDSGSLCEWNDCGKNLLQEPASLPLSRNGRLVQWVQLDRNEGLIISNLDFVSPEDSLHNLSDHYQHVIITFRKLAHHVHSVLNSPSLKNRQNEDNSYSSNINKLTLNEHGVLFQLPGDDNNKLHQAYWVVGRLVLTPLPRELYVCYEDSCPQNMVEIAFRLALNSCL